MYIISENEASRDTAVPFLSMGKLELGLGKEVNIVECTPFSVQL